MRKFFSRKGHFGPIGPIGSPPNQIIAQIDMTALRKWAVEQAIAAGANAGHLEFVADTILAYVTKQD